MYCMRLPSYLPQVFTLIFVAEMIWKLLAIGPLTYVKCGWNVFDALIVIASIAGYLTTSGASFSILRSLRLVSFLFIYLFLFYLHDLHLYLLLT